jgi:hypothetical protein
LPVVRITCVCPGARNVAVANSGSGGPVAPNVSVLRIGTIPNPNCETWVNVCVSPPRFVTTRLSPFSIVSVDGEKFQVATLCVAVSSAMNAPNVTVPEPTHAPAPRTALNVAGSQASFTATGTASSSPSSRVPASAAGAAIATAAAAASAKK